MISLLYFQLNGFAYHVLPAIFYRYYFRLEALLKEDKYKDIIVSSLQFLVDNNRVKIFPLPFLVFPVRMPLLCVVTNNCSVGF
jgi:hypothetical protein